MEYYKLNQFNKEEAIVSPVRLFWPKNATLFNFSKGFVDTFVRHMKQSLLLRELSEVS